MNLSSSVDNLITRLESIKTNIPNSSKDQNFKHFSELLHEASDKISELTLQSNQSGEPAGASKRSEIKNGISNNYDWKTEDWIIDSQEVATLDRPNIHEFMVTTGIAAADAREILYGVIGSNADLRNWSKIMASNNPVDAARAATAQLYNSNKDYALLNHADYGTERFKTTLHEATLSSRTVIQRSGNFAEINAVGVTQTMAVSKDGLLLRGAGSTQEQIQRTAWLFGFDMPKFV